MPRGQNKSRVLEQVAISESSRFPRLKLAVYCAQTLMQDPTSGLLLGCQRQVPTIETKEEERRRQLVVSLQNQSYWRAR